MMSNKLLKENGVNLFISQQEIDKKVLNKEDSSTAYIILQNNVLQEKYDKISKKLYDITNVKDTMEEDNDRLEKSKICLQGYVKNYFTLASNLRKIADVQKTITKICKKIAFESNLTTFIIAFLSINNYSFYIKVCLINTIILVYSIRLYSDISNIKLLKTDVHYLKMLEENDEITSSSKLLDEIIDNF